MHGMWATLVGACCTALVNRADFEKCMVLWDLCEDEFVWYGLPCTVLYCLGKY